MATNTGLILQNLLEFYDFSGKAVVVVGAGGGQLAEYGRNALKIIAVDSDRSALEKLRIKLLENGLTERFELVEGDFASMDFRGDAVLFEFCLHEMPSPVEAVRRALRSAPDVLVLDHLTGSEWAYCAAEEEKVAGSWRAIDQFVFARYSSYLAEQHFAGYSELYEKVKNQGETSIRRIEMFRDRDNIRFPMPYALALIRR
jgi:ubiquinone/menaquinone biosynthesis C-methylase UbiE